jgi:hypothetical protein
MEMVRCMIGTVLRVEDEKLKRPKILVVAEEERIDLLGGRGMTSLVRYKTDSSVSSVCLHLSLLNLDVCWSLHLVSLISALGLKTFATINPAYIRKFINEPRKSQYFCTTQIARRDPQNFKARRDNIYMSPRKIKSFVFSPTESI